MNLSTLFTILMKAAHYLILILMGAYTIAAYAAFRSRSREVRERLFLRQDWLGTGL